VVTWESKIILHKIDVQNRKQECMQVYADSLTTFQWFKGVEVAAFRKKQKRPTHSIEEKIRLCDSEPNQ
jgi:hypothetical protein